MLEALEIVANGLLEDLAQGKDKCSSHRMVFDLGKVSEGQVRLVLAIECESRPSHGESLCERILPIFESLLKSLVETPQEGKLYFHFDALHRHQLNH